MAAGRRRGGRRPRLPRCMHTHMHMLLSSPWVQMGMDGDVAADHTQQVGAEDHQHEADTELRLNATVGEILTRNAITVTARNSEAVCPMPQMAPTQMTSRPTARARRWWTPPPGDPHRACLRPSTNPNVSVPSSDPFMRAARPHRLRRMPAARPAPLRSPDRARERRRTAPRMPEPYGRHCRRHRSGSARAGAHDQIPTAESTAANPIEKATISTAGGDAVQRDRRRVRPARTDTAGCHPTRRAREASPTSARRPARHASARGHADARANARGRVDVRARAHVRARLHPAPAPTERRPPDIPPRASVRVSVSASPRAGAWRTSGLRAQRWQRRTPVE